MIGDWIKAQRTQRGWTQTDLAERSGISAGYVQHLERNRRPSPGPDIVRKLARAFEVSADEVLDQIHMSGDEIEGPPIEELQAVGWPDDEIRSLEIDWPHYSARERNELIATAHEMYAGEQEMKRRTQEQKERMQALLRRPKPTTEPAA